MLIKLIKHEWKAIRRFFIPLHIFLLIIACLMRIVQIFDIFDSLISSNFWVLFTVLYFLSMIGVSITVFILIIIRFNNNFFSLEGYLTLTLPVTINQHLIAKIIVSLFSVLLSILINILLLVFSDPRITVSETIDGMYDFLDFPATFFNLSVVTLLTLIITYIITTIITQFLTFYTSICIGQLFQKNKMRGSVAAYIVIYIISRITGFIFTVGGLSVYGPKFTNVQPETSHAVLYYYLALYYIFFTATTIIYYSICYYILRNKVNLD